MHTMRKESKNRRNGRKKRKYRIYKFQIIRHYLISW